MDDFEDYFNDLEEQTDDNNYNYSYEEEDNGYIEDSLGNFDDFMNDSDEFTSFITSGYGTRPTSTLGTSSITAEDIEEENDACEIINSLHLDIPELEPILSSNNSPKKRVQTRNGRGALTRPKMTDLGFKMSKMILKNNKTDAKQEEEFEGAGQLELIESGDSLVDNYGQPRKKQKTGKRGRPKGTVKVGTQFGRASSTHALPPNVSALMGQANVAYVQKQYPKAIELYLQVVQRAPASPEPYYSLGLVYEEQGNFDKAASYFLITAHLQPRADGDLWRKIAALLVQVDPPRKDQAIYCLTRAIKAPKELDYRFKDDFPLFWLRAKLQLETGQYRSVISGFGTALRGHFSQDPEDLELFVDVAKLAVKMSLAYVAAEVFENVFRSILTAALPLTWSHLNLLIELAEIDKDYAAVLEAIDEFAVPCYLQSGREQGKTDWILKSPQEQLAKALESDEMPAELKLKICLAQVHLRKPCASEEILGLLQKVEKPGIKLKLATAEALSLANAPLSAVKIFIECIEEDSSLATSDFYLKIGQNYRKGGEIGMAIVMFLAVLEVDSEHKATRLALSEAYRSLGQAEQALQVLPPSEGTGEDNVNNFVEREEFINWQGLDELFTKIIGIGVEARSEDLNGKEEESSDDSDGEIYSSQSKQKLRFGPERQKRANRNKKMLPQMASLRQFYDNLMRTDDREAGETLLQYFSDNVEYFRSRETTGGGLEAEEWSEALLKILILQAKDLQLLSVGKSEWNRLIRILKSILGSNLRVGSIKWRVLGLILGEKAGKWDDFMIENVKALISSNTNGVTALISSGYLQKSQEFLSSYYHPITFRFFSRLNLRLMQSNPALLVLLGHQSLETLNYEEATKMYMKAEEIMPQWRFLKLCIGNALLGRAFQRTCSNQMARLMQAMGYFLLYIKGVDDDQNGQRWFNVARAFHQAGFMNQAVQFYEKSIGSGCEWIAEIAKYNLSRLYLQSGSPGMARALLKNK